MRGFYRCPLKIINSFLIEGKCSLRFMGIFARVTRSSGMNLYIFNILRVCHCCLFSVVYEGLSTHTVAHFGCKTHKTQGFQVSNIRTPKADSWNLNEVVITICYFCLPPFFSHRKTRTTQTSINWRCHRRYSWHSRCNRTHHRHHLLYPLSPRRWRVSLLYKLCLCFLFYLPSPEC